MQNLLKPQINKKIDWMDKEGNTLTEAPAVFSLEKINEGLWLKIGVLFGDVIIWERVNIVYDISSVFYAILDEHKSIVEWRRCNQDKWNTWIERAM